MKRRLDQCLNDAVEAGAITRSAAKAVSNRFEAKRQQYRRDGLSDALAAAQARDDVIASVQAEILQQRHAKLRMLARAQKNVTRYGDAHAADPRRLIEDVNQTQREYHALQQSVFASIAEFLGEFRPNVLGTVRGRALLREVIAELHGKPSGNPRAADIGRAVREAQERLRVLFNDQGGAIGKLADFGMPHRHDGAKIRAAGFADWRAQVFDRLDWHRIIDHETGKPFTASPGGRPNGAAADRFLREVFDGITTGGWDDRFPSFAKGGASTANSRNEHRVLHFRDGDAWWDYNEAFGAVNGFEAIVQHLDGMARDIALMRNFGPNPRAGLLHASQVMERAATLATDLTGKAHVKRIEKVQKRSRKALVMMDMLSGRANRPADAGMARFFAGVRNLLTAAQLGGASLSQVTDWPSMALAAKAIGLNPGSTWHRSMQAMLKGVTPQQAKDFGYIFDTWFDAGNTAARFMGNVWSPELTSRITNGVMRLNGMAFLTDRSRFGVALAFGSDMAEQAGKSFDQLPAQLRVFMENRGITASDWDALRAPGAMFTDPTGGRHVSADWFRRHTDLPAAQAEDIAIRWGALVRAHQEMAIPTASLEGRASIVGESAPGSLGGELLRSTVMYKSFVMSLMFNQSRRIAEIGDIKGRAAYIAMWAAVMIPAGAIALQLKEIAKGRDPRPMDDLKFWGAAALQSGGLGIFGDFFSSTTSRTGGGLAEVAGGPVVGIAGDVLRAFSSNAERLAEGKDMLIGRDIANLARRYNPLATFQPPIPVPVRTALDRILWDNLQRLLDPEAEDLWRQQQRRQQRDYGNAHWWRRGRNTPDRAPDLSAAAGDLIS